MFSHNHKKILVLFIITLMLISIFPLEMTGAFEGNSNEELNGEAQGEHEDIQENEEEQGKIDMPALEENEPDNSDGENQLEENGDLEELENDEENMEPEEPDTQEENITESSTHITIITGTTGVVAALVDAYHNLTSRGILPYSFTLKIFSPGDLELSDRKQLILEAVLNSNVVLLEMVGANRHVQINEIFSHLDPVNQPEIFVQRSGEKNPNGSWATTGFIVDIVKDLNITVNKNHEEYLLEILSK
ncbi:MAG: hypothetical protein CVU88_05585 [Firmicutes bacterium HGW-Firmicutes-13]|nr:MAG: hypothetical protein CVU88_05585 [Firmicutes bacterium HGW-Firmicutes-13]